MATTSLLRARVFFGLLATTATARSVATGAVVIVHRDGGGKGVFVVARQGGPFFDAWDSILFSACTQPDDCPSGYLCEPICFVNIGRCFTTTACIAEVPIGGVCTPDLLQECASGSVGINGSCTADAAVLGAVPLGGGCDDPAATCAAGLMCKDGGTHRQRVAPISVAPLVCTRPVAEGEPCDDTGGAVCCADGGICGSPMTNGVPPFAALAGVCRPPLADPAREWPCTTDGPRSECVPLGTICVLHGGPGRCVACVEEGRFCAVGCLPCDTRAPGRLACVADATLAPTKEGAFGICRPLDGAPEQGGATQSPTPTPTPSPTPTATRRADTPFRPPRSRWGRRGRCRGVHMPCVSPSTAQTALSRRLAPTAAEQWVPLQRRSRDSFLRKQRWRRRRPCAEVRELDSTGSPIARGSTRRWADGGRGESKTGGKAVFHWLATAVVVTGCALEKEEMCTPSGTHQMERQPLMPRPPVNPTRGPSPSSLCGWRGTGHDVKANLSIQTRPPRPHTLAAPPAPSATLLPPTRRPPPPRPTPPHLTDA